MLHWRLQSSTARDETEYGAGRQALVQRQHEFDGSLRQWPVLPLPPGEGRGEGPQRFQEKPLTLLLARRERGKNEPVKINVTIHEHWEGAQG